MARTQDKVSCPSDGGSNGWTELTNAAATNLKFYCDEGIAEVRFTADGTEPGKGVSGIPYRAGWGEGPKTMSQHTTLSGAVRAWARPLNNETAVFIVDHD